MPTDPLSVIRIRGARTHNLKNISLELPRNRLVVITGLSGSGKSSLAFDTLYAEGQRRYVESLSAYARQFLQLMEKPDVDLIEGLSPAIAIEQKATSHNPRSTVGTVTEIHDYLRLLFARVGTPYCPDHPDQALEAQSVSQMVDAALALAPDTRLMVLAPVVADRKGEHIDLFEDLRAQGFVRVRVRTEGKPARLYELDDPPRLGKTARHSIEVVVDRLKVAPAARQRLAESFETALRIAQGRAIAAEMDSGHEHLFSNRFACPICSHALSELEPRLFSFNNPMGACPQCDGLGTVQFFDPARIVLFPNLGLGAGAIRGWDRRNAFYFQMLQSLAAFYDFDIETPFEALPEKIRRIVLHGSGKERIPFVYLSETEGTSIREHAFEGVIPNFERRYAETDAAPVREELARYLNTRTCTVCQGSRLRPEARNVRVGVRGKDEPIWTVSGWTLGQTRDWFETLELPGSKAVIGERIIREIGNRLRFLVDVGLDYLSLERSAETLSGGEAQRIRLASQIGSGLTGVMYVLDEPSIGLHQRDNDRLIGTLRHLRDLGNSVLVVEHDEDAIRAADHVIDMGPGAGVHGGEVVAQGTPDEIAANPASLTGRYLCGALSIAVPASRGPCGDRELVIRGARGNNLRGIDVAIPVGLLVCVTGVSGSGKSTLINDTLHLAVARHLYASQAQPAAHDGIDGLEHFDKVISVDQSPIGRTPRSNPATYTALFGPISELMAETPMARERGYGPGRFSFNVKGGRCEACEGDGVIKVEMNFLPDVYVPCDVCHGRRYNRETLEVRYKGRDIAEVLDMTVEAAHAFFAPVPTIARKLQTLLDVGLGYLRLGQSATTLSGGEAQRVKLSLELSKRDTGRTLYILDEPTTGLHFQDIALLLKVIATLRDHGNTVVVIEHNLDVIKTADWLIDMGPEGGAGGGMVVACGTPEEICANPASHTGRYLAPILRRGRAEIAGRADVAAARGNDTAAARLRT
ncbi:MAG: excinuclease ABC subunit UvrA [Burkholderiales bacterium]|nr:excinuclease ABC subunit UvrA [Burkholderiales bacterium]